ncbi:MAG: DEAD/DEAH box helicase [Opitutales bacterium]|nr:DEAD/DEAH box helicase [Opitutales bacterium]
MSTTQEDKSGSFLKITPDKGLLLTFRIVLPPNLPAAAARDAIPVQLQIEKEDGSVVAPEKLDRRRTYQLPLPHLIVAGHLERWCDGKLAGHLQLTRQKLGILLNALKGENVFFHGASPNRPIPWLDDTLPGVSEHLGEALPKKKTAPRPEPEEDDDEDDFTAPSANAISAVVPGVSLGLKEARPTAPEIPEGVTPMEVEGSPDYLSISLPSKDHPLYEEASGILRSHDFLLDPSTRKFWLRDRHKVLNFLAEFWEDLKYRHKANFTEGFKFRTRRIKEAKISCRAKEENGVHFVSTSLEAGRFHFRDVQKNISLGKHYIDTKRHIVLIPPKKLKDLETLQRSLSGNHSQPLLARSTHRIQPSELAVTEQLLRSHTDHFQTPKSWKKRGSPLSNLARLGRAPIPRPLEKQLRPYQKTGAAWMYHLFRNDLGGILADEMGLGKTIQALALMAAIRNAPPHHTKHKRRRIEDEQRRLGQDPEELGTPPFLVVCPAGLLENWKREARRFTPQFRAFINHGSDRLTTPEEFTRWDIIFTSYATLIRDEDLFRSTLFKLIIADEAQHIKNRNTRNAKSLCSLLSEGRFLLTGTPIENSIDDLLSLFDFLLPGYLHKPLNNPRAEERTWYEQRLQQKAAPYILRRTKQLVAPELPPKIEQVVYCELSPAQRRGYNELKEKTQRNIFDLEMSGASEARVRVAAFSQLLRLRQFCCDPRLIKNGKEDSSLETEEPIDSAKMASFLELVQESMDSNHRILVFSQFVSMLTLLRKELDEAGLTYCYLDGKTKNRLAVCDRFNNSPDIPLFLISLKAGGVGLNLTGADTVIHFDPWWNPAAENQATDRAHRIGQKKVVTNIKLIASDTVEERVVEMQRQKSIMLKDLFAASEQATAKINLETIKELLE